MKSEKKFARRAFLGTSLVGAGGAFGWLVGKSRDERVPSPHPSNPKTLGEEFRYDISEFEKTDPKHLLYKETESVATGFEKARRITVAKDGKTVIAGDRSIKIFEGRTPITRWDLGRPAHCLLPLDDGNLLVGLRDHFQIYDLSGKLHFTSPSLGGKTYLTSMSLSGETLFLADAGNREIVKTDLKGTTLERFGKKEGKNPGFAIPSPYFDLMVASDGNVRVVNPGRLRVETYSSDGQFISSWGEPGMKIDRFCGCCNPVYMTMTPSGEFITSEKGLARIKIYNADGSFKGTVAGPDMLVKDKELVRKINDDSTSGSGFDVAMDSNGNVLVLDPYQKNLRTFAPIV